MVNATRTRIPATTPATIAAVCEVLEYMDIISHRVKK